MSLHRLATPLSYAAFSAFRTTQSSPIRSAQICARCLRNIHRGQGQSPAQRRRIVSVAAERPQDLETHAPPRNAGVPNTSIAGGKPGIDFRREPSRNTTPSPTSSLTQKGDISVPESEAQQSQSTGQAVGSVAAPSPAPGSSQSKPQRKSKLKPRKAAMTLSPAAVEQLRELLNQPEPKLIRVGVKNRGCSGLAYHLEYVEKPGAFDEAVDQDGVKVLVDSKALFSIIGSEMDWVEDKLSRRFIFKNPNITEQCGCGESFSIS